MRRSMGRLGVLVAVVTTASIALAACSGSSDTASSETAAVATSAAATAAASVEASTPAVEGAACDIGMVQINQTAAFFTQMNDGAQEAASANGCTLTISNANNDAAKQSSDIENFVAQGVTGLIVVAIDVEAVLPAVAAAREAGIKVVAIDAELKEGSIDTFVGVDNAAAGATIGEWAVGQGVAKGAKYGVVDAKNSFIQNLREDNFKSVVDAAGATYTQSVSGDNVQEKAAKAAEDLVTAQPDLAYIYTTGEPATVGAAAALTGNSTTKIIGWDLTKEVISAIDSGLAIGIVQQNPKQEGVEAVNELKSLLDGNAAAGFIDVPIAIVTKDNVDEFRSIFP